MTAQLVQAYNDAGDDRNFEIVLFGYDRDQDSMNQYMTDSSMPFAGVNKSDEASLTELKELGSNGYLPLVALVTPDGKLVTTDRAEIMAKLK